MNKPHTEGMMFRTRTCCCNGELMDSIATGGCKCCHNARISTVPHRVDRGLVAVHVCTVPPRAERCLVCILGSHGLHRDCGVRRGQELDLHHFENNCSTIKSCQDKQAPSASGRLNARDRDYTPHISASEFCCSDSDIRHSIGSQAWNDCVAGGDIRGEGNIWSSGMRQ